MQALLSVSRSTDWPVMILTVFTGQYVISKSNKDTKRYIANQPVLGKKSDTDSL